MSAEENKALTRRFFDGLNRNDLATLTSNATPTLSSMTPLALPDGTEMALITERNIRNTSLASSPPCRGSLRLTT